MASSAVEIANLALDAVGTQSTIQSLTENSPEANAINRHYKPARDEFLRVAPWDFARKQINLSLLKDGTQTGILVPQPWLYEYAYPSDCIQARYILPQFNTPSGVSAGVVSLPYASSPPTRFMISTDLDTNSTTIKVLLTNQTSAILVYTQRIEDESLFDSTFVYGFAHLLASRIAFTLTGDRELTKTLFQVANDTSLEARARNGVEGLTIQDVTPSWIRARGYVGDYTYPIMWEMYPNNLTLVY